MIRKEQVKSLEGEVIDLYKRLHQIPELGMAEYKTAQLIAETLRGWGIETTTGVAKTGVVGVVHGKLPGKTVALRADMDALPITEETGLPYASQEKGKMHACGHDGHVAMLLGAAHYCALHQDELKGTVKFLFQPAEEDYAPGVVAPGKVPGGAYYMIQEGWLDDVDACMGIHLDPCLPIGALKVFDKEAMAATDQYTIVLEGKGGHGGAPHQAVDVIPALAVLLGSINTIIPREISAFEPAVLSVRTVNTISSAWNATPGRVEITGTFRTYDNQVREQINRRLGELAASIAKAHRCSAQYVRERGYDPTVNDPRVAGCVAAARQYLGEDHVLTHPTPLTGGEDVGFYFQKVPGAFMFLGCAQPGEENHVDLHSPYFRVCLEGLIYGTLVHLNNLEAIQSLAL